MYRIGYGSHSKNCTHSLLITLKELYSTPIVINITNERGSIPPIYHFPTYSHFFTPFDIQRLKYPQ